MEMNCQRCKDTGVEIIGKDEDGVNILADCPDCIARENDKTEAQLEDAWESARELRLMDAWDAKMQERTKGKKEMADD